MRFVWTVAWRLLRDGRFQTWLIVGGVTIGVAVVVYITAIIDGLQVNIIDRTLSSQAHVVLRPAERLNQRAWDARAEVRTLADVRKRTQREATIGDVDAVLAAVRAVPGVQAAAAVASGPGVAQQGGVRKAIVVLGVDLADFQQVIRLDDKRREGTLSLAAGEALIGSELASDLGLAPGARVRLQSASGEVLSVRVAGVLDYGVQDLNRRRVLLPLRDAQSLLGYGREVTEIDVRVQRLFEAQRLAADLSRVTGLTAESWQAANGQLVTALRSQSASGLMIRFFVTLAVALGIASVLVVSVVQRQREIGILRAMGTPRQRILAVFLLQGGIVGLGGSLLGTALGAALAVGFTRVARNADGSPLFPIVLQPELFVSSAALATLVGVLAAWLPARRAARLDPVEAIRG
ncbi:ABC transporter permease [uncultured Tepidimonas sp.]|uniref:ABC transporter permease n=1 Tax=uncultured Tepidimonas sp. TaxID=453579 RepID=UPI002606A4F1|nr:ABC transporter permease [uncultured Tepidimonas sp.]